MPKTLKRQLENIDKVFDDEGFTLTPSEYQWLRSVLGYTSEYVDHELVKAVLVKEDNLSVGTKVLWQSSNGNEFPGKITGVEYTVELDGEQVAPQMTYSRCRFKRI